MSTEIKELFESMEYGPAPESAAQALEWIAEHSQDGAFGHLIDGAWTAPNINNLFETRNPATGVLLAKVSQADADDVDHAIDAARAAQLKWWELGCHGRARYLYAIARHIQKHARLLAVLETLDNGKPIRETRDIDIPLVARHFYHHAGWAQLMDTELPGHEPIGVVGQIIPWNFPLLMLAWKIAPALAMGNTVVLKPAEYTSLTALTFAHICSEIGLPPGVVNIVTGDGAVGELIVNHTGVDKIAFTGSTEVGRAIRRATAGRGKRLSLELGGKSPFIVFDDADLDSAVEGIVDAIWFNQGQVCCAGSRLLMQESIAEKLVRKIRARMQMLRVGDPMDKAIDIGAIVSAVQLTRISEMVNAGASEGANIWQDSACCPATGCFYPPTLITGVSPASVVAQEEIFGPVLVAMTFRTPSEAVELANNTRYGLAASVWTENVNIALDIAPKLKAGTVWINCTNLFDAGSGFGGYRESGYGREGGREGLWEYVREEGRFEGKRGRGGEGERGGRREGENEATGHVTESAESASIPLPSEVRATWERLGEGVRPGLGGVGASLGEGVTKIDRTAKLFIGGKQVRPDSGYTVSITGSGGNPIGEVGDGNRKDIRNAVEAAKAASGWGSVTAHLRAQILYYLAENLEIRAEEFALRITAQTGVTENEAAAEVQQSIERVFTFAALADKYEGAVHPTPFRNVTLAMPEPMGIIGIACPETQPLLGFISTVIPAIAMGNTVIAIPSQSHPLSATDLYQVLETSDVPAGVVNIVTGNRDTLAETLAGHDEVTSMWYWGSHEGATMVERLSAGNMKRTWCHWEEQGTRNEERVLGARARSTTNYKLQTTDYKLPTTNYQLILREATQVKNIWIPYGE